MRVEDVFPKTEALRYRYDFFKMTPPGGEGFVDFGNLPGFELEFGERYELGPAGFKALRHHNGQLVEMVLRLEEAGLFWVEDALQDRRCAVPLPLVPGSSLETGYGVVEVLETDEEGFTILERLTGEGEAQVTGSCRTRFTRSAWIARQEVDTNRMHYLLRRLDSTG